MGKEETEVRPSRSYLEQMREGGEGLFEWVMVHHRWFFVVAFLLPLSVIYDVWYSARSWIVFLFNSAPHAHATKVEAVQKQVRLFPISTFVNIPCSEASHNAYTPLVLHH